MRRGARAGLTRPGARTGRSLGAGEGGRGAHPMHSCARMTTDRIRNRITGANIPPFERIATGAVGLGLALYGVTHRGLRRRVALMLGAAALGRAITGSCPIYRSRVIRGGIHVQRSTTILATPHEVYELWRDLPNLPRFMSHVSSIEVEDARISRWTVQEGPMKLEWRAELVEEEPGHRLRWRSLPGGDLWNEGVVELRPAPGDRGTVVEVKLSYRPPGGIVVASLLHGFLRELTYAQLGAELARLRQLIETGEIATGERRLELDDRSKTLAASDLAREHVPAGRPPAPAPASSSSTSAAREG